MGFLATLFLSIVFIALGFLRPRLAFYLILALIVLFDELGPGFSTYTGSWVFNPIFVGFYRLRLIEVLVVCAYIPFLIAAKNRTEGTEPFGMERSMLPLFVLLVLFLTALEYAVSKTFQYPWRPLLPGVMLFHMLMVLFKSNDDHLQLVRVFLILVTVKCVYGLGMWAVGMGVMTPRGRLPFTWDSRQIEAFGLGSVILTAYLLNYHVIDLKERIFPFFWAFFMWATTLVAVGGSIRRTIWVSTVVGMVVTLFMSKRTTILHYFAVLVLGATTLGVILLAPGLEDVRKHMGRYVESMNLFDDYQRSGNIENDVHVSNVESYGKMLLENPDLVVVGFYGPSGSRARDLMSEYGDDGYRLGMAHNGPIRTILFFGIAGLVFYFWIYGVVIRRTLSIYWRTPDSYFIKHVGLAAGVYLFLNFTATMTFVPPFYTSSKGVFYAFFELFLLGAAAHLAVPGRGSRSSRSTTNRSRRAVA